MFKYIPLKLTAIAFIITNTVISLNAFLSPGIEISYRSFSGAETIGPPAEEFAANLESLTNSTLGRGDRVAFAKITPTPPIPNGDIVAAVGQGGKLLGRNGFDSAYVPGSSLNPVWGFIFNSGIPVTGVDFDRFIAFLYGDGGLELLQTTLDRRNKNIIAIPLVGGPPQGAGYFPQPVGDTDKERGIGLRGLCQKNWTFRYLPPAQNVLDNACDRLVGSDKKINFVQAVPGVQLLEQVSQDKIQAFEFVTPKDDLKAFFSGDTNPGTLGLRYLHYPAWHQPFLITYLIINKQVWAMLSQQQQELILTTARASLTSSYAKNLSGQGEALQKILNSNKSDNDPTNDLVLASWPDRDLALLKEARDEFLEKRLIDNNFSKTDRQDYQTILTAYQKYLQGNRDYSLLFPSINDLQN